ncbi:MAG: hypothetical protein ACYC1D_17800 [Acidimicrobiales bacterium]
MGLLRLRKGFLSPTRVASDDIEVIRRLRSWFGPRYGYETMLTTDTLALLAVEGPSEPQDMAGLCPGRPDLIEASRGTWSAGPSARWLLPRATALAHLWSA